MARLREGERLEREKRVWYLLRWYALGLREIEIAQEVGWQRRTVNNYLRALAQQNLAYKDGR